MKQSNFMLTVLVALVMVAAILAIGFPGWNLAVEPFAKFDKIEFAMSESQVNEFLKLRSKEPRPKAAGDEWKKYPEAAWKANYDTGGKPDTIIVWFDAKMRVLAKEFPN